MESEENVTEKSNVSILMLGLDEAGKTTLLYKLKLGGEYDLKTIPTMGFNVETIEFEQKKYCFWDIGAVDTVRVLWKFYTENKAAVVFVVDASDPARFGEAKDFLHSILAHEDLKNVELLLVSNKHDKEHCSSNEELKEKLNVESLKKSIRIVNTSAFDSCSLQNIMIHLKDVV